MYERLILFVQKAFKRETFAGLSGPPDIGCNYDVTHFIPSPRRRLRIFAGEM